MMQGKIESDDSEAETEILSAFSTPLKGRKVGQEDSLKESTEAGSMVKNLTSSSQRDSVTHASGDTISIRKKRKSIANEGSDANGSPVWSAGDEGNGQNHHDHHKSEARSPSHSQSMSSNKIARSARKINVGSRPSDAPPASGLHSSDKISPHGSISVRSQSPHTHFALTHNKHLKPSKISELTSQRAATHEPRSSSRSATPPARQLHKRSSSFHSALTPIPRERKRRIDRDPNSDSLSYPAEFTSPSITDALASEHPTPSYAAPMSGRTDRTGRTALARACEKRDLTSVQAILQHEEGKDDLNIPDNAMNRPIQFAALQGSIEIVKVLIDAHCEVDVANSDGDTPLIDAIARGHVEIVELLLRQNIDPNRINKEGKSPEDFIRDDEQHANKILELLKIARSKYVSPKTEQQSKPKHSTLLEPLPTGRSRRDQHIRNDLFYVDASLERMHHYAEKGDIEGVRHMIKCGIKADNDSAVAAASRGHHEVLEQLVIFGEANCDPDPESVDGETPMLAAIARGHLDVIEYLLSNRGFNVMRKYQGKHYDQVAARQKGPKWVEVTKMLREASKRAGKFHVIFFN